MTKPKPKPMTAEDIESAIWHRGKSYGRGELANELLRVARDGSYSENRGVLSVNLDWLKAVADLQNEENEL